MGKNNRARRAQKKRNQARRSKGIKKKMIQQQTDNALGPVIQKLQNPFSALNEDERKQMMQVMEQSSEKMYQESLAKIIDALKRCDPIHLMSVLALYGLTVGVGDDGIQNKNSDSKIHQAHIEVLQALALQAKPEEIQRLPCGPEEVQEVWDNLVKLMQSHFFRDFAQGIEEELAEDKAVRLVQKMMRSNTQMVRNWGYFSQVKSISQELYGCFDGLLQETYGFSANNIIDLFQLLMDDTEERATTRHKALSQLFRLKSKTKLVFKYHELIGLPTDKADQFMRSMDIETIPYKSLFAVLMSHYDLWLHECYEFSPAYLSGKLGIDETAIKNILKRFSYEWGDLASYETEYFYLSNPVWLRPIIKIEVNKYFCTIPQAFFSFVIPSLDGLTENIDKAVLSDRRAKYLEKKLIEIITRRFPESNTVSGVKWKFGDTVYETDLITFLDSHAVIVEAKSGRISDPALRGAPARLKRHIEEILVAPNIQSKRLKERLEDLINNPGVADEIRDKLPVDINNIHKIIRVSVSLENFASIQANIAQLKETGWLPEDFEPCPTMSLADFETLFDFLEHPVQIIHYLERRQELEGALGYMGDELDLMGLYIGTLFNMGDIEQDTNFVISEMSSPLDVYYNSRDAGVTIPKPQPKISPLFSGIMEQLEERHLPRWTEIGVILNRFSPDDQRKFTAMIEALKENVRNHWMIDGHKNMVICVPPKASQYAMCYVMYNNNNWQRRNEFIQAAATAGLEAEHVRQCIVIAKNLDKDDLDYHFIGLME